MTLEKAKRCMEEHQWSEAISILREALVETPNVGLISMCLGSCYYELRDYDEALKWFDCDAAMGVDLATAIGLQADVYHALGDSARARELYQQALEIDPTSELAIKNWERFLLNEGGPN